MAWEVGHPLKRDGASQRQRLPRMLSPERVSIDARPPEELLAVLYRIAGQFSYYNLSDTPDGSWEDFFPEEFLSEGTVSVERIRAYLAARQGRRDTGPFITILLAFLHLYRYLQDDINRLSGEHLKFYYEQVLRFRRRPPRPDQAYVLFELSPQIKQHHLPAGTELKAGKDGLGKPLTYMTSRDIVLNQARIAQLKTVLVEPKGRIYAAEIANSADGLGAALAGEPPSWSAFGNPLNMQLSTVGLAVASHLLLLQEGQRTITLTLSFDALDTLPEAADADELFRRMIPYASGEDGWIELRIGTPAIDGNQVGYTITAEADQPAIVPFDAEKHEGNLSTSLPVLRLLLDPQQPPYTALNVLRLRQIDLAVKVMATATQPGLQQLVVQNDQGPLAAGNSFQPFGPSPAVGSRFYIGSQEAFSKPLESLTIQIRWAGLPNTSFSDHYEGYNPDPSDNDFTVSLEYLNANRWRSFGDTVNLFSPPSDTPNADRSIPIDQVNLPLNPRLPEFEQWDPSLAQGFIRLTLDNDFGHKQFPQLFAEEAASHDGTPNFPNPPYTPTIQSISLGYQASQAIPLNQAGDLFHAQLFHILPFGSEALPHAETANFLPELAQGNLYIGLEKFQPPQNLNLLFQALEGSAESVDAVRPQDIQWHYLTTSGWSLLSGQKIFTDTTVGLQQPGIVAFSIGRDAVNDSTALPNELHWLRATIDKAPAGAARMIAVDSQAVTVTFRNQGNDPDHLLKPLTANSIKALSQRNSAIKKVLQPYGSFNGAPAEKDELFYTRVSERLRHKQRTVGIWDYERLLLVEFPEIYKTKAIPHTGVDKDNRYKEFLPGHSSIVVIPQSRRQNAVNRLEPKASTALLEKISRYLRVYGSGFVGSTPRRLHVLNPRYEPIRLSFSVGFREGFDSGFYREVLNDDLRRHLSPWAFDEGADIAFGGNVYKSQLLTFVEERDYVDYVTDFRLFHENAGPGIGEMCIDIDFVVRSNETGDEVEVASASTAASILVSAALHSIEVLEPGEYPCDEAEICGGGIGCMYIDIDFVVGATE